MLVVDVAYTLRCISRALVSQRYWKARLPTAWYGSVVVCCAVLAVNMPRTLCMRHVVNVSRTTLAAAAAAAFAAAFSLLLMLLLLLPPLKLSGLLLALLRLPPLGPGSLV